MSAARARGSLCAALALAGSLFAGAALAGQEFERGKAALAIGDHANAYRHFRHGALRDDARCQHFLGVLLLRGAGVEPDPKRAAGWFRRAAKLGLGASANALGSLHLSGRGVEKDPVAAARWFRRTALHGDATGQTAYGLLHLHGVGVERSPLEASVWLSLGAKGGHPAAAAPLAQLEPELSPEERVQRDARVASFRPRKGRDEGPKADPKDLPELQLPAFRSPL